MLLAGCDTFGITTTSVSFIFHLIILLLLLRRRRRRVSCCNYINGGVITTCHNGNIAKTDNWQQKTTNITKNPCWGPNRYSAPILSSCSCYCYGSDDLLFSFFSYYIIWHFKALLLLFFLLLLFIIAQATHHQLLTTAHRPLSPWGSVRVGASLAEKVLSSDKRRGRDHV